MISISNYNEENTIESHDTCYLHGEIKQENIEIIIRYLLEKNFQSKKPDHVNLIINTEGGLVNEGFALVDIMNSVDYPIWTYGIGDIFSCGTFIFIAGQKGHRYLFPNAIMMTHQWSMASEGKKDELEARQQETNILTNSIIRHFMKYTGKDKKEVEELFFSNCEKYYDPKNAIKYGLADSVVKKFVNK
jgi:ATP-dependent Clp protease protease subunit